MVYLTLSGIRKEKMEVVFYRWECELCGKKLEMQNERALLKLIERHQAKDAKDRELQEKFRELKAHISGRKT